MFQIDYHMTPTEYKAVDKKLDRIGDYIVGLVNIEPLYNFSGKEPLWDAYRDVERCRRDVKYEYLSLNDSWL